MEHRYIRYYTGYRVLRCPEIFNGDKVAQWMEEGCQLGGNFLQQVWWTQTNNTYHFFDGEQHPNIHPQGPPLQNFRNLSQKQLNDIKVKHWDNLLQNRITLPTPYIQLYKNLGFPTEKVFFPFSANESPSPRPTTSTHVAQMDMSTPTSSGASTQPITLNMQTPHLSEDAQSVEFCSSDDSEDDVQGIEGRHQDFETLGTYVYIYNINQ